MKLKVQHVMDSTLVLTNIINRRVPMPQRGKYLLARMHMKLLAEYNPINARRDDMIKAYNTVQTRKEIAPDGVETEVEVPGEYMVPADKLAEFQAAWKEIGAEEIDVDVNPLPITAISMPDGTEGLIEAGEFITLADLVHDNAS